ncbi:MAG: phenylacetate--CoA ligase family protein, partial [Methylocystis sp.]
MKDTSRLPFFSNYITLTSKHEIALNQLLYPPYGTNLTYPLEAYNSLHQTSGTTTNLLRWLDTPESWNYMLNNWTRIYSAAKLINEDRLYFAFSFGPFLGFWTAFEAASRLGYMSISGGGKNTQSRIMDIINNRVTILLCTPTYAMRIAEIARLLNIDLRNSSVRLLILAGESGASSPHVRDRISKEWNNARIVDHYGMTEVGPISYQCPVNETRQHIMESSYFVEIIDPKKKEIVDHGETGELVITTLRRAGSPLIRYCTGDIIKTHPRVMCDCGSSDLFFEGGVLSRADDMVVVRGVNIYPSSVEDLIHEIEEVSDYRARVISSSALTQIEIDIEPKPGAIDHNFLINKLDLALRAQYPLKFNLKIVNPGTLQRGEFKTKKWFIESTTS